MQHKLLVYSRTQKQRKVTQDELGNTELHNVVSSTGLLKIEDIQVSLLLDDDDTTDCECIVNIANYLGQTPLTIIQEALRTAKESKQEYQCFYRNDNTKTETCGCCRILG